VNRRESGDDPCIGLVRALLFIAMATPHGGFSSSLRDEGETSDVFLTSPTGLFTAMIASFIPGIGPLIAAGPLAGAIAGLSVGADPKDSPES
jgi:hypothetical protein